jgi:hypothetical protein
VEWRPAFLTSVLQQLGWLAASAAIASVTRSLPTYLLGLVTASAVWLAGFLLIETYVMDSFYGTRVSPIPFIFGASCIVLWRQYHRRNSRASIVLLTATYLVASATSLIPWGRFPALSIARNVELPALLEDSQEDATREPTISIRLMGIDRDDSVFFDPIKLDGLFHLVDGQRIRAAWSGGGLSRNHRAQAALQRAFEGYKWFGPQSNEEPPDTSLHLELASPLDRRLLRKNMTSFTGWVALDEYAYERFGGLKLRPGSKFIGGSVTIRSIDLTDGQNEVVLELQGTRIGGSHPEELILVDRRRRLAVRSEPFLDDGYSRWFERFRAGRPIYIFGHTRSYRLPLNEGTAIEDLDLEVWKPVLRRRFKGRIELTDLANINDREHRAP